MLLAALPPIVGGENRPNEYECASQEKMEMLPAWIEIFRQATLNPYK